MWANIEKGIEKTINTIIAQAKEEIVLDRST